MITDIIVKRLNIDDVKRFKVIRLEMLLNEPSSFGSSFEEESAFDDLMWNNRLKKKNVATFGAFSKEELVGIVLGVINPRNKLMHIATLNSVYVKKEYRSRGIGKVLTKKTMEYLFNKNVEIINLSVATTNKKAINLYESFGFNIYGEEKKAIKLDNKYINLYLMSKIG
jgi:ribosomal protein S18 acetylase RimI-like enzyme